MSSLAVDELLGIFDRVMVVARRAHDRYRALSDAPGRHRAAVENEDRAYEEAWHGEGLGRLFPEIAWDRNEILDRRDAAFCGIAIVEFLNSRFGESLRDRVEKVEREFRRPPSAPLLFDGVVKFLAPREEVEEFISKSQDGFRRSLFSWSRVPDAREGWRNSWWGSFDSWYESEAVQRRVRIACSVAREHGVEPPQDEAELRSLVWQRVVEWSGPGRRVNKGTLAGGWRTAEDALGPGFLRDMLRSEARKAKRDPVSTARSLDEAPDAEGIEAVSGEVPGSALVEFRRKLLLKGCRDDRDQAIVKARLKGISFPQIASDLGIKPALARKRWSLVVSRAPAARIPRRAKG